MSIDNIANERGNVLEEVAFFDVYPWKYDVNGSLVFDEIKFFGAWSVYPYFGKLGSKPEEHVYSSKVVVQSTTTGLYVLDFDGNMDFSAGDGEGAGASSSDEFEWDSAYGYVIIAAVAALVVALAVYLPYRLCYVNKRKKRVGVYESIIAMPDNGANHSSYGTDNAKNTGPANRM